MAAATVSAKVRAAHRGRTLLVVIESSIVGLSTGIATFAVGSTGGMDPHHPQALILLVLVGILGALSWWMERSDDAVSVARSIDRRFGWRGAVTTAFETESVAGRTPVADALARTVSPLVSPRLYLASEMRSSAAVLAAPFLALALLSSVTEARRSSGAEAWLRTRATNLSARARSLASASRVSARDIAALETLAESAGRIGSRADPTRAPEAPLAALEAEMARLSREIEASRAPAHGAGVASAVGDGTMVGRDPGNEGPAADPMRETPSSKLVPNAGDPALHGSGAEGGVGASRWWPERYDGVVERWIEARRAAAADRTR